MKLQPPIETLENGVVIRMAHITLIGINPYWSTEGIPLWISKHFPSPTQIKTGQTVDFATYTTKGNGATKIFQPLSSLYFYQSDKDTFKVEYSLRKENGALDTTEMDSFTLAELTNPSTWLEFQTDLITAVMRTLQHYRERTSSKLTET